MPNKHSSPRSQSGSSDSEVPGAPSEPKHNLRTRKKNSEPRSTRPARSTRVNKVMLEEGSDIEFISESPATSRAPSIQRATTRKRGQPRSTFLGVYIPKLRPSEEMIREMRQKQAAAVNEAAADDAVDVTNQPGSPVEFVIESSVEDEEDEEGIDNDLGVALQRSTAPGSKAPSVRPMPERSRSPTKNVPPASPIELPEESVQGNNDEGKKRREDSDADETPRRMGKGKERREDSDDSDTDAAPRRKRRGSGERKRKPRCRSGGSADEGLNAIELDEPERFKTTSRLREVKKSAFQQRLGSLQKKRRGKIFGAEVVESSSEESSSEEDRRKRPGPSKNRKGSQWKFVQDDLSDFIASDDDNETIPNPRGRDTGRNRNELDVFTFKRETPEYKFKVVFQYLLVLAIKGPNAILPLRGSNAEYYGRSLRNVREQMSGVKSSITSVLWRPEFLKALKKYPQWKQARLDKEEDHCEACNRSKQACQHEAWLRGSPYHPEKHEDEFDRERAELAEAQRRRRRKYKKQGRDMSSSDSDDPREIGALGATCLQRTSLWHELHHWEHRLYHDICHYYHDLLRAKGESVDTDSDSQLSLSDASAGAKTDLKRRRAISQRRVTELKKRRLPRDPEDVDEVTEWMDGQGYQRDAMRYLTRLEARARELDAR
ncbi:hypothetical protein CC85DRAFT_304085 [Cutaneotrichosporon oleaginosum]|uniref:DUF4211 domain-containing protein n=1 Tax=Cutaneotrichosporon oleaginosum TaxID=879819 RepID=A0A0J0XHF6_9TREE|nr:uncharacterized protein CC85DRAFT_304085 [Cutaneotrichosporon oleaginosum]KLT40560.1 hypothetical protein CC85DRAFT_304085 [Cutaneotrichosporon oleaginosum]TXT08369.1 hypothetical protein COLE_05293 [Cutaneotrichosporon oleaginosum]